MQRIPLILILLMASGLLLYNIGELMPFIGDQGWFYLSARDMLLTGNIPLVGITSSHTWLHQGPLWTYMLATMLWLFHFNPMSGAYLTIAVGIVTVILLYKIGTEMFSERIGLIAALLYSTSPMVILYARMPYHTSFIPTLTLLLFYFMYKWVKGYRYSLPLVIFLFALLYNFEIATITLAPIFVILLLYGLIRQKSWVEGIFSKKIIILSLLGILIPMIPMLLYDIHHGFPQTVKVIVWIVYKIATHFGYPQLHPDMPGENYVSMIRFASVLMQKLIFLKSAFMAWIVLLISFIALGHLSFKELQKKHYVHEYSLLLLFFIIPVVGYVSARTNSEAYVAIIFPIIFLMNALVFDRLMRLRHFFLPGFGLLIIFVLFNIVALFQSNFLMGKDGYGPTLTQRIAVSKEIIREANGKEYTITAKGQWTQFASFTMNYEYLTGWLGHGPSHKKEKLNFIIREDSGSPLLQKEIQKL